MWQVIAKRTVLIVNRNPLQCRRFLKKNCGFPRFLFQLPNLESGRWICLFLSLFLVFYFILILVLFTISGFSWNVNEAVKLTESTSRTLLLATDTGAGHLIKVTHRAEIENSSSPLSVTQRYALGAPRKTLRSRVKNPKKSSEYGEPSNFLQETNQAIRES